MIAFISFKFFNYKKYFKTLLQYFVLENKMSEDLLKYLEINYFDMLYKTNKEEKEKKEMEYTMLKEEINLTKKQAKLSTPAFFISLAALIIAIIELCLG